MNEKDGGPAFPHIVDPRRERKKGMTLRDHCEKFKKRAEEAEAKLSTAKATGRREMAREVLATFPNSIHDCPTLKKWLEDQAKGGA